MVGVEVTCAADRDTLKNTLLNVGAISNEAEWLYEALPVRPFILLCIIIDATSRTPA